MNSTDKKMPAGSVNYPAGHTDTQIVPGHADAGNKVFATLRAQFALRGHALYTAHSAYGDVTYYAKRWGLVRYLPTLDDARQFLAQIGGEA